jgi:hypothetical protein
MPSKAAGLFIQEAYYVIQEKPPYTSQQLLRLEEVCLVEIW